MTRFTAEAAMTSWKAEKTTTDFMAGMVMTPLKAEKITIPLRVVMVPTLIASVSAQVMT